MIFTPFAVSLARNDPDRIIDAVRQWRGPYSCCLKSGLCETIADTVRRFGGGGGDDIHAVFVV